MISQRTFILGEKRYIQYKITSTVGQAITIPFATYKLSVAGESDLTGDCEIDDNIISVLVEPVKRGNYVLDITYGVMGEKRIIRVNILVI